jgi:hypothetical protein
MKLFYKWMDFSSGNNPVPTPQDGYEDAYSTESQVQDAQSQQTLASTLKTKLFQRD